MNRTDYLERLSRGLERVPPAERAEILADYERYFADGAAAGRSEADLSTSLGDPSAVAADLRMDHELRAWRNGRGARSAGSVLLAIAGLLLADGLLLIPWALAALCALGLLVAGGFALLYGLFILLVWPFDAPLGGFPATLLRAVGCFSGGVCAIAVSFLLTLALARAIGRLRHLHRRALRQTTPEDHP